MSVVDLGVISWRSGEVPRYAGWSSAGTEKVGLADERWRNEGIGCEIGQSPPEKCYKAGKVLEALWIAQSPLGERESER